MLRDIPKVIKIKGNTISITPSSRYTCDAVCKTEESFCISEEFTAEERYINSEEYIKDFDSGVISYRNIMWNCWERLELKLKLLSRSFKRN